MRLIFILLIVVIGCSKPVWKTMRTNDIISNVTDSTLISLQKQYDVILLYNLNRKLYSGAESQYFGVALRGSIWYNIEYKIQAFFTPGSSPFMVSFKEYQDKVKADSVLRIFLGSGFLRIKEKNEGCEEEAYVKDYYECFAKLKTRKEKMDVSNICGVGSHPNHKQLIMITKKIAIQKTYTEPELWENCPCCPRDKDRQTFIKCSNAILTIK